MAAVTCGLEHAVSLVFSGSNNAEPIELDSGSDGDSAQADRGTQWHEMAHHRRAATPQAPHTTQGQHSALALPTLAKSAADVHWQWLNIVATWPSEMAMATANHATDGVRRKTKLPCDSLLGYQSSAHRRKRGRTVRQKQTAAAKAGRAKKSGVDP